jgi:crotonobetainyl-CoA:carnitine CoA-transferase CaiB-like acyl-CoA transferase
MWEVVQDDLVLDNMLTAHDSKTGTTIHLPAPAVVSDFIQASSFQMKFPPRLGQDNERIYKAVGLDATELEARGVI